MGQRGSPHVGGHLADGHGVRHPVPGEVDDPEAHGDEEEEGAHQVNPGLGPLGEAPVNEVNAHVGVVLEGVGAAQEEDEAEEVPLGLG